MDFDVKIRNPQPRLGLKMSSFHNKTSELSLKPTEDAFDDQNLDENIVKLETDKPITKSQNKPDTIVHNLPNGNHGSEQDNKPTINKQPPSDNLVVKLWKDYSSGMKINHSNLKRIFIRD
jgi:hypothetical protein